MKANSPLMSGWMCRVTTSNKGLNSPPSAHRVGELCDITWNKNTISLFSTCGFTSTRFGWGFSRDRGGSSQSLIIESKICEQMLIILYNVNDGAISWYFISPFNYFNDLIIENMALASSLFWFPLFPFIGEAQSPCGCVIAWCEVWTRTIPKI
jgi:hypothetical protein